VGRRLAASARAIRGDYPPPLPAIRAPAGPAPGRSLSGEGGVRSPQCSARLLGAPQNSSGRRLT